MVQLLSRHVAMERVRSSLWHMQLTSFHRQPLVGIAVNRHWIWPGISAIVGILLIYLLRMMVCSQVQMLGA
jgi:hypothetical protein